MELLVMMVNCALAMINVLLVFAKDLEDVFVEMAMFLLLLKIVNLLEVDVVIQLAISLNQELFAEQQEEFVTLLNIAQELLLPALLI